MTTDLATLAAQAIDDKQGHDIAVLDVSKVLAIVDHFVITSAPNSRLVRTLADSVAEKLAEVGVKPLRTEGLRDLTWVLLDYGDLVVHVFSDEMRAFYEIERLYRDAPTVDWQKLAS